MKRLFLSFLILIVTGFSGIAGAAQAEKKADVVSYGGTCAAVL